MPAFSQRKQIRPMLKLIQRDEIDFDLRKRLWSGIVTAIFSHWSPFRVRLRYWYDRERIQFMVDRLCLDYFKRSVDEIFDFKWGVQYFTREVRDIFYIGKWWEIYDLIEFLLVTVPEHRKKELREVLNCALAEENSAYRIVGDQVADISDEHEIEAVESALDMGFETCRIHLFQALKLLSDRKSPDYRNSIKESISAVESACKIIAKDPKATFGSCIKLVKDVDISTHLWSKHSTNFMDIPVMPRVLDTA